MAYVRINHYFFSGTEHGVSVSMPEGGLLWIPSNPDPLRIIMQDALTTKCDKTLYKGAILPVYHIGKEK